MTSPRDSSDGNKPATALATFGAGCFWCTEAVYLKLKGVLKVTSGYTGGRIPNPTYQAVCTGTTGHAEVIQVEYDPSVITFDQMLDVFFHTHDPTTLNRQGADTGTQYRSAVFYHDHTRKTRKVLSGRRLPSGLFQTESWKSVLPGRHCAEGQ